MVNNRDTVERLRCPEAARPKTERPLPDGWQWVRLGDVCEFNPRRPDLKRTPETPTTFVQMSAVDDVTGVVIRPEIKNYEEVRKGYTFFAEEDVLFAKITPCMQNGKHAVARNLIDGIGFGSTEFHVIRSKGEIAADWIHKFVRQTWVLQGATAHFTGAVGQQRVPVSYLSELQIPLPPLSEQKRIAGILNEQMGAIERARAATEAQLEAAKALPAAYLREVFDSEEAKKWPKKKLRDVCTIATGTTPSRACPEYFGEGIAWVTPGDFNGDIYIPNGRECITELGFKKGRARLFPPKTVLLVCIGATIGKAGIASKEISANQQINALICNPEIQSEFLYFHLKHDRADFISAAASATLPIINQARLGEREIPLPPVEEQERISAILLDQIIKTENAEKALKAKLDTINKLPAALLRRAFNGEI